MSVLFTNSLSKRYRRRLALDNLNLNIEKGQIFGLLGPNGAGKTTTIKILLGLIRPSSGEVRFFDEPNSLHNLAVRRRIGALVESPCFLGYLTGRRHLQILSRVYGRVDEKDIDRVLDVVQMTQRAGDAIRNYSLGMRQRLGIAQALLRHPELLILDEPTNGLDPRGIADIRALLLRLNKEQGLTIFVSSHMLAEVEQLCTHVGFVDSGRLLTTGKVSDVLEQAAGTVLVRVNDVAAATKIVTTLDDIQIQETKQDTLLLQMNPDHSSRIAKALHDGGLHVHEIHRQRKTLEDIFLELISQGGDT